MKKKNNITTTHLAKYVKNVFTIHLYVPIKVLTANTFQFTYNANSIRDLASLGTLRTFTESVVIFRCFVDLNCACPNLRLKLESSFELLQPAGNSSTIV